jgi:glucuronate isomerase
VLSSTLNQELCSFAWIFPNVLTSGHWWYANVPAFIAPDLRARLQAVPKTKQLGYYSDMYKLEFGLPKFNMYRGVLASVLAEDFVRPGLLSETRAVELARCVLRDNVRAIFRV